MAERLELLERVERRLYASWMLHALAAFAYWLPPAQGYLALASTTWFHGLPPGVQELLSLAYWLLAVAGFLLLGMLLHWRTYTSRLAAKAGSRLYRRVVNLSWPLGVAAGYLAVGLTGASRPVPVWLLTYIAVGSLGVAVAEYAALRRMPVALLPAAAAMAGLLFLPLVPRGWYVETVYSLAVVSLGYSLAVLGYALRSLSLDNDLHDGG